MFNGIKDFFNRLFKRAEAITPDVRMQDIPPSPEDYVSKRLPAIPYDDNSKQTSVPMLCIVDETGHITGYLPMDVEDNGDGTATIKVILD